LQAHLDNTQRDIDSAEVMGYLPAALSFS